MSNNVLIDLQYLHTNIMHLNITTVLKLTKHVVTKFTLLTYYTKPYLVMTVVLEYFML